MYFIRKTMKGYIGLSITFVNDDLLIEQHTLCIHYMCMPNTTEI